MAKMAETRELLWGGVDRGNRETEGTEETEETEERGEYYDESR